MTSSPSLPRPRQADAVRPDAMAVRALVALALAIWLLSLALPGYFTDGADGNAISGLQTLALGVAYGWIGKGWAAYANLLFLAAGVSLSMGRRGTGLVAAMLLLMMSMLIYDVQPNETGAAAPVTAWGLGAVAWVVSLGTMAMACVIRLAWASGSTRAVTLLGALLGLVVLGAGSLMAHPIAMPGGLGPDLLSKASPCGIAVVWPDAAVIPKGEIVALDVDPAISSPHGHGSFVAPIDFVRFQQGDHAWDLDGFGEKGMSVRLPPQPRRYAVQVHGTPTGAVLRVMDAQAPQPLYEQRLETLHPGTAQARLCPGNVPAARGYVQALLKALGQGPQSPGMPDPALHADAPSQACDPSADEIGHDAQVPDMHRWDGRDVRRDWYVDGATRGFCSADYAVLVTLAHSPGRRENVVPVVRVYDRHSLHRIVTFQSDGVTCSSRACLDTEPTFITGVRFDERAATLSTRDGDWTFSTHW